MVTPARGSSTLTAFWRPNRDDVGMETHGFAVVPHARMGAPTVEEPPEAVADGRAFGAVEIGGPRG